MSFPPKYFAFLFANLCLLGGLTLAQEHYLLLPEDLSAETHPSKQKGYQSLSSGKMDYFNGTIRYGTLANPNEFQQGNLSSERKVEGKIETLEDSIISYRLNINQKISTFFDGENFKDEVQEPFSGLVMLIDMKPEKPVVELADEGIEVTPEIKEFMQNLEREYLGRKTLNPWTPDLLIYGKEPRKVGEIWTLDEDELKQLNEWYQATFPNEDTELEYQSYQVELQNIQLKDNTSYAILNLSGNFMRKTRNEQLNETTTHETKFEYLVSRNLEKFLDTSTKTKMIGTFLLSRESQEGNTMKIESQMTMKSNETASVP